MHIALSFPGCHRRGGVERIVFECARYLDGAGHEVTVFADEWEPDSASIRYHRVPSRRTPGWWSGMSYFQACTRELRNASYDVLNTHGSVCPTGGVHWVQSVHRAWLERSRAMRPAFSADRWKQRLNPFHPLMLHLEALHFQKRRYLKLIATTPHVREDLHRLYNVPREDVVIIPNGFSPTEFNPVRRAERRATERRKIGLADDQIAMLFVANELDRKGYATILDGMKRLGRKDLRLIVVGRPDVNVVRQRAAEAGLADQVLALGSASDVAAFHAAADIFVLPTQYEAFCLAILEALGSGMPVITAKVPGAEDAIQPGVNGLLIDDPRDGEAFAAAVETLLDSDRRSGFSARAPGTVAQYQWPTVLATYAALLASQCAQPIGTGSVPV